MTDYAKPTTPADALRDLAKHLLWKADDHQRQANEHVALANALREESYNAENEADRYDKWQPKPEAVVSDGGEG